MAVAAAEARPEHAAPPLHTAMMGMFIFLASEVMFFGGLFAMYFYLLGSHVTWPPPGTSPVHFWPLPVINTVVLLSSAFTCHFGLEALSTRTAGRAQQAVGAPVMAVAAVLCLYFAFKVAGNPEQQFELGLALYGAALTGLAAVVMFGVGPLRAARRLTFFLLWTLTILLGAGFEGGQAYEFVTAHIRLNTNEFASAFFTMTGFHGLHVAGGLLLLLLILWRALRGQFDSQHHVGPAAVTLYWHFVDVVWIFLFGILYLAVTLGS